MDRGQSGMVEDGGLEAAGSCQAQKAKGQLRESWHDERGSMGKNGVWRGARVVPPLTAVGFGRVLECLDVIRHGNDREKDEQKHCQGNELGSPARTGARGKSQPQAEHQGGQPGPCEIEE